MYQKSISASSSDTRGFFKSWLLSRFRSICQKWRVGSMIVSTREFFVQTSVIRLFHSKTWEAHVSSTNAVLLIFIV